MLTDEGRHVGIVLNNEDTRCVVVFDVAIAQLSLRIHRRCDQRNMLSTIGHRLVVVVTYGQGKMEGGAYAKLTLYANTTADRVENLLHQRQSHSRAYV